MWYIYTMEYYSAIKRKEINGICSNMDGPRSYHAKWSQSDNETPTSNAITDMWNLNKGHKELLCRTDTDSQTLKNLWFLNETGLGMGGCTEGLGWTCYRICFLWLLYTCKCNKFHLVIKNTKKIQMMLRKDYETCLNYYSTQKSVL